MGTDKPTYDELLDKVKQHENELEKLKNLVDFTHIAMHFYTLNDKEQLIFSGANQRADETLGITNKQLIGKTIEEAFPKLTSTDIIKTYKKVAQGEINNDTLEIPYEDDRFSGHYEVFVFRISEREIAVNFIDISNKKRAENELKNKNEEYEAVNEELRQTNEELYKSKERIEANEAKFKAFTEQSPIGIYMTDGEGSCIYANQKWLDFAGMELKEALGKGWVNALHPDDKKNITKNWYKSVRSNGNWSYEYSFIDKNGKVTWLSGIAKELLNEDNQVTGYLGTNVDITAEKEAKEKAKEVEIRFKTVFENSQDAIGISRHGINVFFNPAYLELFGFSNKNEIIGKPILEQIAPEERNKIAEIVKKRALGEDVQNIYETIGIKKNGEKFPFEINVGEFNLNNENYTIAIIRDISERKAYESELKIAKEKAEESEQKFRTLFKDTKSVQLLIDPSSGNIVDANQAACEFYGYSYDKITTLKIQKINQFSEEKIKQEMQRAKEKDRNYFEFKHKLSDGTIRDVEVYSNPIFIDNEKFLVSIIHDITARKNAELDLIKAKEKAEESNRLKNEFINNMSHEIRTPMNGILGFSEFLNNEGLSEQKRTHYISIIQNSGKQLLRIIDDILEISQLGTKQVGLSEKAVCLNDILLENFSIFDIRAKENSTPLYLKKGLPDEKSFILTDETKLNKILSNLLENALNYTNEGFIEFGYELVERENHEFQQLLIYVKDTGIGIKPENHTIIFDRFSQEDKKISIEHGGLGLGLSISKENAQLLGGDISVESEKGKGSTFFVTIPYKPVK